MRLKIGYKISFFYYYFRYKKILYLINCYVIKIVEQKNKIKIKN